MIEKLLESKKYVLNVRYWEELDVYIADIPILSTSNKETIDFTTLIVNNKDYRFITEYNGTKLYKNKDYINKE